MFDGRAVLVAGEITGSNYGGCLRSARTRDRCEPST